MTLDSTIEAQTNRYHRTLNPVLWNMLELKEDVRTALLAVANNFVASWGFDIPVKDIVLTGSNANYNWTIFSDCDVHVIVDTTGFRQADKAFVADFLKVKKTLWNLQRKVKIKGYPVEVYAQDTAELLVAQGVFSLQSNKWVKKPNRRIPPKPNMLAVKAKVEDFTNMIDDAIIQGNELSLMDLVRRLSEMRKAGLASKGEFSTENLAFKIMRNDGTIAKLRAAIEETTDKRLTLESAPPFKKRKFNMRRTVGLATEKPGANTSPIAEAKTAAHKKRRSAASKPTKKYKYVNHHKGPKVHAGGLSGTTRWKKHRIAKIWAWKRARFARLSREKPGGEKQIGHRTYMAARNITYKDILGKRKKSKLPYGERARAERTARRVYKLNVKNPESRLRYKYRRKDTRHHSGTKNYK